MAKVLVMYVSVSGNTEKMARLVVEGAEQAGRGRPGRLGGDCHRLADLLRRARRADSQAVR